MLTKAYLRVRVQTEASRRMSRGNLSSMQPLPVKAEREAEREEGEKALWALVNLGWLWLQETCKDRHKRRRT